MGQNEAPPAGTVDGTGDTPGRLQLLPRPLKAFLVCLGVVGLTLGVVVIGAWPQLSTDCRPWCGGSVYTAFFVLLVFGAEAGILGAAMARGRRDKEWLAGYIGVVLGGMVWWCGVNAGAYARGALCEDGCDVVEIVGPFLVDAWLVAFTALIFYGIGGALGRRGHPPVPTAPSPSPGAHCPHCGKVFSEGLAIIYRGKPCPNCGQPWG